VNDTSDTTDLVFEAIVLNDGKPIGGLAWAIAGIIALVVAVFVFSS